MQVVIVHFQSTFRVDLSILSYPSFNPCCNETSEQKASLVPFLPLCLSFSFPYSLFLSLLFFLPHFQTKSDIPVRRAVKKVIAYGLSRAALCLAVLRPN